MYSPTKAVLFDLGSASTRGSVAEATTIGFGLGETAGTSEYDLACLISTIGTKAGFSVLPCPLLADYVEDIIQRGDAAICITVKAIAAHMREEDPGKYDRMVLRIANELGTTYAKCFQDMNELFPRI
jgi:hypothetical protein